ncbi:amino acid adenylation domain-containing protein [Pseudoalteromonas sp. R3]|uniref:amino acid adenylation domain-containing protein n=1 Tax=Pseudoalteromonas sp. R3 TaxID=1709477 RepID=UPI0006B45920|nr:amino acid adenylation domain-containing protein [Pseudoalteromonas sp. R3]AZZ96159.1 non-ribosomal peptide synthetase [Pseudoalteromonas sp. R3]
MNLVTVADMVAQILKQPAQVQALAGDDWTLSYGELRELVACCLAQLKTFEVQPNECVAIYGDDPRLSTAGVLSALLMGCPFVCLDTRFPVARKQHMLARSQVRVLFYSQNDPQLGVAGCKIALSCNQAPAALCVHTPSADTINNEKQHVAYHVYTSGSTGLPKGISISRHSLAQQIQAARQQYQLTPDNRALCILSSATDAFLQQLLMFLSAGACVYFTQRTVLDPAEFAAVCISHNITHIDVPPSLLATFLADPRAQDWFSDMALSTVILGGEEFSHNIVRHWERLNLFERVALYNEYGPSEATVTSCLHRVTRQDLQRQRVPIGRPSAGSILLIVDAQNRPAKEGELLIGGEGLALEYLAEPQKTADKFITMQRLGRTQRFYRSGDLVKRDEQGLITYLGRQDNQVNLLGHRIELEGIEAVLDQYPGVQSSAVLAVGSELIAFVAGALNGTHTPKLRKALRHSLPDYMLPARFYYYSQLPTTAIGKIDKQALQRTAQHRYAQASKVASVSELIAHSLNIPRAELAMFKGYKEQGGDSLKALALQLRAKQHGWTLSLSQLLNDTPLAQLEHNEHTNKLLFSPELLNYALPNKLAMIYVEQIARWQVCSVLFTRQQISSVKVHQVARILLRKYPTLRLRFNVKEMTQSISKGALHLTGVLDVTSFDDFKRQACDAFKSRLAESSLHEQLVTIASYRSRYGHIVAVGVNHLLVDDISLQVLSNDLDSLLHAPRQFDRQRDWALLHWQQQWHCAVMAGRFDEDLVYWRRALSGKGTFCQEAERKLRQLDRLQSVSSQTKLGDPEQIAALTSRLAQQGQSLQTVLCAALAHSYRACTAEKSMVVALENNGRQPLNDLEHGITVEVGQAVGWFAQSAPLLLHSRESFEAQLETTCADLLAPPVGGHSYGWLSLFSEDPPFKALVQTQAPRISLAFASHIELPEQQLFAQPRLGLSATDWLKDEDVFSFGQLYHWLQIRFVREQEGGLMVELKSDAGIVSQCWLDALSAHLVKAFKQLSFG